MIFSIFCNIVSIFFMHDKSRFYIFVGVRVLMFIFSFYLVAISFMPCTDGALNSVREQTVITTNHEPTHKEHNHSHEGETCSPLCHCGCCSISVNQHQLVSNNISKPIFSSILVLASYQSLHPIGYLSKIWQPPRFIA